jgi:hypothetical protein
MRCRFNSAAFEEMSSAARYYESCRTGLGEEFVDEVHRGIATILEAPNRWAEIEPGRRKYRIDRFPYGLLYHLENPDLLEIDVLMDLRRKPGYWRSRFRS